MNQRASRFAEWARPVFTAVILAAGPMSALQAAPKVIRMIPGGDLKIIDPIQNPSYITRNHAMLVHDTLYGTNNAQQVSPQMLAGHQVGLGAAGAGPWRPDAGEGE